MPTISIETNSLINRFRCIVYFYIYVNQTISSEIASIPEESLAMAQNLARQRESFRI